MKFSMVVVAIAVVAIVVAVGAKIDQGTCMHFQRL